MKMCKIRYEYFDIYSSLPQTRFLLVYTALIMLIAAVPGHD